MSTGGGGGGNNTSGVLRGITGRGQPLGDQASAQGPTSGAVYTPVRQAPVYQPQYQQYQMQQPTRQQPMMQQQMPNYQSGLQAAMMHIMQQYSRPMMRAPMQQGLMPYNSPALNYRPNMPTDNLNRVAPSVELQQKQAAEEAARQAAIDAANAPQGGGE